MSTQPVPKRGEIVHLHSDAAPTTFAGFAAVGYRRLIPVVPVDAPISEKSTLFKRPSARGKAPGYRGQDGLWRSFDWLSYEADDADYQRWQEMQASIGLKMGDGLCLIDADTLDPDCAAIIRDTVAHRLGSVPERIGRSPKAGYLVRVSGPIGYQRVEFGEPNEVGRLTDRVEILSDGRQCVVHGLHSATRKPYTWSRGLGANAKSVSARCELALRTC